MKKSFTRRNGIPMVLCVLCILLGGCMTPGMTPGKGNDSVLKEGDVDAAMEYASSLTDQDSLDYCLNRACSLLPDIRLVRKLVDMGAKPEPNDTWTHYFNLTCDYGGDSVKDVRPVVEYLLDKGATITTFDDNGVPFASYALMCACANGNVELVDYLMCHGAIVDSITTREGGLNALMSLLTSTHPKAVENREKIERILRMNGAREQIKSVRVTYGDSYRIGNAVITTVELTDTYLPKASQFIRWKIEDLAAKLKDLSGYPPLALTLLKQEVEAEYKYRGASAEWANGAQLAIESYLTAGSRIMTESARLQSLLDAPLASDTTPEMRKEVADSISMTDVPGGSFQGWPYIFEVSPFTMSTYEITMAEYVVITDTIPSYTYYDCYHGPARSVSWYEALVFCNRLSVLKGRAPVYSIHGSTNPDSWGAPPYVESKTVIGDVKAWNAVSVDWNADGYRLPTSAEWKWAAMGATKNKGYTPDMKAELGYKKPFSGSDASTAMADYAWYAGNSNKRHHTVGSKLPNELGIYDMSGSVMEWCWDWSAVFPYGKRVVDYKGEAAGSQRVMSGGCRGTAADAIAIDTAVSDFPYMKYSDVGLRIVSK